MHMRSIASWLLISYFTPFIAFFFAIFSLGLTPWIFLAGMFVVSMMTLFLFLKVKDWEIKWHKLVQLAKESSSKSEIETPEKTYQEFGDHPITQHILAQLRHEQTATISLLSQEKKEHLIRLETESSHIIDALEEERQQLFLEIEEQIKQNKKAIALAKQQEEINSSLQIEIANLQYELDTLLKMDHDALEQALVHQ